MAMIFDDRDEERLEDTEHEMPRHAPEHGDFARGIRQDPSLSDVEGPDFARGIREDPGLPDAEGPDFARGIREEPGLPDVEGPDFARGERELDEDSVENP